MSITDELRAFFDGADGYELWCPHHKKELTMIADRIDAAHQKAEDEWKAKDGQAWLHGYAECRAELMEGNEAIAADLEKAGWLRLPKDADGETIRVGEELVSYKMGHEHFVVDGVGWHDGTGVVFHTAGNCLNGWNRFNAELCHHVQPDSWERIIEDAQADGVRYHNDGRPSDFDALVERCRRLAGEGA